MKGATVSSFVKQFSVICHWGCDLKLLRHQVFLSLSHHHITLQVDEVQRLFSETKRGGMEVALNGSYANPSHFAQLFRRETSLTPSDYRQQR